MQQGIIEFDRATKVYPGSSTPSVDELTMTIGSGEICALVGPSGSGKTTAMRMVNRLIDPTRGEIRIDGRSVAQLPVEQLRRSIGYVIQQVGLFPHRTVLDNVATVPRLLGWSETDTLRRANELIELVGLDPNIHGRRYPSQLSGGQRQRIGVARALAADPPVMLMDEPFGAIDPVVRTQIQDEFLRLQKHVSKTIIIVTHDVDEAIRMGDKIAVLREGGVLARFGSPAEVLANPGSEFVATFLGSDSGLKRLALATVAAAPLIDLASAASQGYGMYVDELGRPVQWADGRPIVARVRLADSLRDALSTLVAAATYVAVVVDDNHRPIGVLTTDAIHQALHQPTATVNLGAPMQPIATVAPHVPHVTKPFSATSRWSQHG